MHSGSVFVYEPSQTTGIKRRLRVALLHVVTDSIGGIPFPCFLKIPARFQLPFPPAPSSLPLCESFPSSCESSPPLWEFSILVIKVESINYSKHTCVTALYRLISCTLQLQVMCAVAQFWPIAIDKFKHIDIQPYRHSFNTLMLLSLEAHPWCTTWSSNFS